MAKPKLPDPKRPANTKTEGIPDMNMMTSIEATAARAAIYDHPSDRDAEVSHERGCHKRVPDPLWANGVLDLSSGRTLEDAISALDAAASLGLLNYLTTWQWEIADIGSDWQILKHEGEPRVYIGCRCDSQEQERSRRIDALSAHLRSVEGAREALIGIYS